MKIKTCFFQCRLGIDDLGNLFIKRYTTKSGIFVRPVASSEDGGGINSTGPVSFRDSCVSAEVAAARGALAPGKHYLLFEQRRFDAAISRELHSAYPDRRRLERHCMLVLSFATATNSAAAANSILDLPLYILLINIVALDELKSKLNPGNSNNGTLLNFSH